MKLWMTRDRDVGYSDTIHFWDKDEPVLVLDLPEFKPLTGLPLPRKGSKRLVEVSISIKPAKGAK